MSYKPSLSTIHGVFTSYIAGQHDVGKSPYGALDTVTYIVSYLQQTSSSPASSITVDTIATVKNHEKSIEQLTNHISLLTMQLNALTTAKK